MSKYIEFLSPNFKASFMSGSVRADKYMQMHRLNVKRIGLVSALKFNLFMVWTNVVLIFSKGLFVNRIIPFGFCKLASKQRKLQNSYLGWLSIDLRAFKGWGVPLWWVRLGRLMVVISRHKKSPVGLLLVIGFTQIL